MKVTYGIEPLVSLILQRYDFLSNSQLHDIDPEKVFAFADYQSTRKRLDKMLEKLKSGIQEAIERGIRSEWDLANEKNDALCDDTLGKATVARLSQQQHERYYNRNNEALEAFLKRKRAGMNLSDRVWLYTKQFKEEIELGLDIGIRSGRSADEMSRDIRAYLKNPDKLFRRVRNEHGQLVLSKRAAAYHPGRGVYRSSYKNARRLAATEVNIAYRTSDHERWQQLDFVVGIHVLLSNNHTLNGRPFFDICDELSGKNANDKRGRYPKDFKFTGWHPLCRCHVISILKTDEELVEDNRRILAGKEPSSKSVNTVKDVPSEFRQWMDDNSDRISRSSSVPYFMTDNPKYTGVIPQRYGSVGAVTGTKLGRAATKVALSTYEDYPPPTLTQSQAENMREAANAFGLDGYTPMSFLDADSGLANRRFRTGGQAYRENCQCCVAVHEARLRGLDISAAGYSSAKDSITYQLGERFQDIWISPKTNKPPEITKLTGKGDDDLYSKLNKNTQAVGRYHIGVNHINGIGHVVTAERLKTGDMLFYDAQSGEFVNIKEFINLESFEILKVDKLLLRVDWLRRISEII